MYNLYLLKEKYIKTRLYFPFSFGDQRSFSRERADNREEGGRDERREVWEAKRLSGGGGGGV